MKNVQSDYWNIQKRKFFFILMVSIKFICILYVPSHHVVVESYPMLVPRNHVITRTNGHRSSASGYDSIKRNHHRQTLFYFHHGQLNINHKKQKLSFKSISKSFSSLSSSLMSSSYSTDVSNHESTSEKQQEEEETIRNATITTRTPTKRRRPICVYRNKATNNRWNERIELEELCIGQELKGIIVQQFINSTITKTGPKLYVDVGVGRYNYNTNEPKWKIQNAMIRLSNNKGYMKESVVRKKISKLNIKDYITVYVNRIDISSNRLEVVLKKDEIQPIKTFMPMKDFYVGQEFNGTVKKICTYGIFIDIGTNRLGLLHIQKIADLYQKYINPNQISKDTDITVGLRMKIQLLSKDKKRLFFDFTNDVKELLIPKENEEKVQPQQSKLSTDQNNMMITNSDTSNRDASDAIVSKTDLISTKGVISTKDTKEEDDDDDNDEYDDDEEEYDAYDEEREIEDQLGLGFY